jgi:uncharacterized protein YneF (UPF0154 family)
MFAVFVGVCALTAGFAIGWCMARHISKKDKPMNEKGKE